MNKNIIIADSSYIIYEGLKNIISNGGIRCNIKKVETIEEMYNNGVLLNVDVVFINPILVMNNTKVFFKLKTQYENINWIAIVYAYHEPKILSLFNEVVTINSVATEILNIITKSGNKEELINNKKAEILSDRETDVLKLLAMGMANKEIADKLSISINTVITHRKNISQKTGIKSLSGLTIYAVIQKIISL
ncbi:MAG: hypothetical protein A2X12_03545 [Bacteroidetes bacterium GWE2_29_8]|nr:MAG: hypothetical protein A2X12_03545 [Bacteroidetes bacterium GWE2_29_8]OFY16439.1 MAG: hypothetical protein A2X02_02755 [Bacteroidetes bacterium GWF2_29_10]